MDEDTWASAGAPLLADRNGTANFIFTPHSLSDESRSQAKDPRHASTMFKKYEHDETGIWKCFHFTTYDNPTISEEGIKLVASGMSKDSLRRELMAEDDEIESSWLVYNSFKDMNKIPRFEIPKEWPVLSGHDFGAANPAAIFVARAQLPKPDGAPESLRYGDYVVFKEYLPGAGKSMAQHIDQFKEITKDRKVEISVGGNLTTEEEIRQGYGRSGWPITAPLLSRVNSQIDRVKLLFEQGKIYVFDDQFHLLMELANCLWELDEENKPKDKIKDEAKYHLLACFVEGTLIETDKGQIPIEDVRIGDMVATRQGYHRVACAGETGIKEVIKAQFSNGVTLTGTPDHPVFVQDKGFIPLTSLRYGDTIKTWKENVLFTTAGNMVGIQPPHVGVIEYISNLISVIYTESFGLRRMGKYLKVFASIIETVILSIMNCLISSVSQVANIWQTICQNTSSLLNGMTILREYDPLLEMAGVGGLKHQKVKKISELDYGQMLSSIKKYANNVVRNIGLEIYQFINSVPITVSQRIEGKAILMMRQGSALSAGNHSVLINTHLHELAQKPVKFLHAKPQLPAKVFNLSVEDTPEYYANGILVHNCLRYLGTYLPAERPTFDFKRPKVKVW